MNQRHLSCMNQRHLIYLTLQTLTGILKATTRTDETEYKYKLGTLSVATTLFCPSEIFMYFSGSIKHIFLERIICGARIKGVVEEWIILMVRISSKQTAGLGVSILVCPCKGGGQALRGTLREFCKEITWEAPRGCICYRNI